MSAMDEAAVRAELAELRAALKAIEVPGPDEAVLRARFRAARRAHAAVASLAPARRRVPRYAAAAAVVLLGVMTALPWARVPKPAPQPTPRAVVDTPAPQPALATEAFRRLPGAPGFVPTASFSVVRVRIPLASLAIVPGTEQGGTIEAELLVGEDGLAHGIRFAEGGAAFGAARAQ